jgi:hypothetical protein
MNLVCICGAVLVAVLVVLPVRYADARRSAEALEKELKHRSTAAQGTAPSGSSDCASDVARPGTHAATSPDWRSRLSPGHPVIRQIDQLQNDLQVLHDRARQATETADSARRELASLERQQQAEEAKIMQVWRDLMEAKQEQAEVRQSLIPLRGQLFLWERRAQEVAGRCP